MYVLPLAKRAGVVEHLMEGSGIRATSRLCGVDKNTVLSLLLAVVRGAEALHNRLARGLDLVHVECDELHSFVKKQVKNITPADPPEVGEQWVGIAFARATKLIDSWKPALQRTRASLPPRARSPTAPRPQRARHEHGARDPVRQARGEARPLRCLRTS